MAKSTRFYSAGSGSVAAIREHPLHPMIVPFPVVSFLGVLASDLMFISTQDTFWSRLSFTLLTVGLVTGALAALLGLLEAASLQRARSSGTLWAHAGGNVLAMIMSFANFKIRWEADAFWSPNLVYLSAAVAVLLLISGWLGGSLTYKHGIGVSERVGSPHPGGADLTPQGHQDIAHER